MRQVRCVSYIDGSCKLVYSNATNTTFNVSRETISDEDSQFDDALKHVRDAQRLSKVHLIDLSLSNRWNWFITITLSPKVYPLDRHVQAVYDLRSTFNRFHVPFVFVPEYHKSGRVHMHCLANLNDFHEDVFHLIESCNPYSGLPVRTKYNQIIYNSCYFAEYFGHNAFVPIPTVEASVNMAKYVAKYITKTMHKIGTAYYYRSRNLNNPTYYKAYITKGDILKSLDSYDDYYINHVGVDVKDIGDTFRYVTVTDDNLCERIIARMNNWNLESIDYD